MTSILSAAFGASVTLFLLRKYGFFPAKIVTLREENGVSGEDADAVDLLLFNVYWYKRIDRSSVTARGYPHLITTMEWGVSVGEVQFVK